MYVLDTDILSIHQRQSGAEYVRLRRRIDSVDPLLIFVTIVSFHEHVVGWNAYLQRARKSSGLIHGYDMLVKTIFDFSRLNVLEFDQAAATIYDELKSEQLRVGSMDLRIAAVALSNTFTVVTRNTIDFERVPGLCVEDWTSK